MRSKMSTSTWRWSMYGFARSLKARSRTARSVDSRKGRSCAGVFCSPSHSTVIAPLTFDHSVSSFESSPKSGTLAAANSRIWLRKR